MRQYRAQVFGDKWPVTVTVSASSWHVAAARAAKAYETKFKGSRTDVITIKIVRE